MTDWKKFRCEYDDCELGFGESFADGESRAAEFKEKAGESPSKPMTDVMYCGCRRGGLVIELYSDPFASEQDDQAASDAVPQGEAYGALLLACDMSGSMFSETVEGRDKMTRYRAVVEALAALLRDFGGKTDPNLTDDRRFGLGGRDRQYHRLLLRVLRFGGNLTTFECPDGKGQQTPWFTLEMLARAEEWPLERKGAFEGAFELAAIQKTVEEKLLPRGSVLHDATNLAIALDALTEAAKELDARASESPRSGLPADYDGIGTIPRSAGRHQAWAVVYTDGEVNEPTGAAAATESSLQRLLTGAPKLNRITAYFGTAVEANNPMAGGLLRRIASKCYAPHATEQIAHLGPDHAMKLRHVVHMATATDKGICWTCLVGESDRRTRK